MPAFVELSRLQDQWFEAQRLGREAVWKNRRLAAQKEKMARAAERQAALEERERKFDTTRRRAEQCQDSGPANPSIEPSQEAMCGTLLGDFDWRAKGHNESMGWLDAIVKGDSAEAIRERGTLLVNIVNFRKHGKCTAARRGNRNGFYCSFSASVYYDDNKLLKALQALPGTRDIENALQFFYVENSHWQTDEQLR